MKLFTCRTMYYHTFHEVYSLSYNITKNTPHIRIHRNKRVHIFQCHLPHVKRKLLPHLPEDGDRPVKPLRLRVFELRV